MSYEEKYVLFMAGISSGDTFSQLRKPIEAIEAILVDNGYSLNTTTSSSNIWRTDDDQYCFARLGDGWEIRQFIPDIPFRLLPMIPRAKQWYPTRRSAIEDIMAIAQTEYRLSQRHSI